MIHTIEVNTETVPAELKKLFRKKLMTGGAVIRLQEGLGEGELTTMVDTFISEAEENNLYSMVLVEIAASESCPNTILERLASLNFSNINRALASRG